MISRFGHAADLSRYRRFDHIPGHGRFDFSKMPLLRVGIDAEQRIIRLGACAKGNKVRFGELDHVFPAIEDLKRALDRLISGQRNRHQIDLAAADLLPHFVSRRQ